MSTPPPPQPTTLALDRRGIALHVTLNRPEQRNAMSFRMVDELRALLAWTATQAGIRAIVLRGAGGNFCAGGDVKDMAAASAAARGPDGRDPIAVANRRFGALLQDVDAAPQVIVAVLEGAVMGGGVGLAAVADVCIAVEGVSLRLPEVTLGITPAQIAPFVARRIGVAWCRRLALTGGRADAQRAVALGLAHELAADAAAADALVVTVLTSILACEPNAVAATKRLLNQVGARPLDELLDAAADDFARLARGEHALAGMTAFVSRRPAPWAGAALLSPSRDEPTDRSPGGATAGRVSAEEAP